MPIGKLFPQRFPFLTILSTAAGLAVLQFGLFFLYNIGAAYAASPVNLRACGAGAFDSQNCIEADLASGKLPGLAQPRQVEAECSAIYFVDADSTAASPTGLNWASAFNYLQDALAVEAACKQIWVAEGIYYPDEGGGQPDNVISATFQLENDVAIYGGFAATETLRSQRSWTTNITILSGDLEQNDATENGVITATAGITGANARHVVSAMAVSASSRLDGFTITGGWAEGSTTNPCTEACGGGLYIFDGDARIANSIFIGNYAQYGGGVSVTSSYPSLENITFSSNQALTSGGGMYVFGNSPTLTNTTFYSNTANTGGGLYNHTSLPLLFGASFTENAAQYGGGMYNFNVGGEGETNFTDVIFTNNAAAAAGGGMYNVQSNLVMVRMNFVANTAIAGGGMANHDSSLSLIDAGFVNNRASDGGGMHNHTSSPFLSLVNFSSNQADSGGGLSNTDFSYPTLVDVHFTNNTATNNGGGVYNHSSALEESERLTFSGNQAYYGGGMYNELSSPDINTATFSGNQAHTGGGVYNFDGSSLWLYDASFTDNQADYGGGMANIGSSPDLVDIHFMNNNANFQGGGMYNNNSSPFMVNTIFSGNQAANAGGGLYNVSSFQPTLINASITGNQADDGGGIFNKTGGGKFINVTVAGNHANTTGGGVYNIATVAEYQNTILWGNDAPNGAQILNTGTTLTYTYSLVEGINPGGTNLDGTNPLNDPLFASPMAASSAPTTLGDYHLVNGSPAVDAGDNNLNSADFDLEGNPRRVDGDANGSLVIDLGPYESPPPVIFVDDNAVGGSRGTIFDGTSWTTAFTNLQDAITWAISGTQIWVAEGTYYPDIGGSTTPDDPNSTFLLKEGVTILGGFFGNETSAEQRNVSAYIAILHGDLEQNDTNPFGIIIDTEDINGTNAYHVVTGSGVGRTAVLDGFTITGGQANGPAEDPCRHRCGGGVYNVGGSPALYNLLVIGNFALENGGGMYNSSNSSPFVGWTTYDVNAAGNNGGGMYNLNSQPTLEGVELIYNAAGSNGGGMYNQASSLIFTDIRVEENHAGGDGGGMFNHSSSPSGDGAYFRNNQADNNGGGMYNINSSPNIGSLQMGLNDAVNHGGAMYNTSSSPTVSWQGFFWTNTAGLDGGGVYNTASSSPVFSSTVFESNSAGRDGGGFYNSAASSPVLTNTTITLNSTAGRGGGMYNESSSPVLYKSSLTANTGAMGGGMYNLTSSPGLTQVVIAGNTALDEGGGLLNDTSSAILVNVLIAGNKADYSAGVANLDSNPVFTNITVSANYAAVQGGGMYSENSSPLVQNSIISGNGAPIYPEIENSNAVPTFTFSLAAGCNPGGTWDASCGTDGGNNLPDADPLFVSPVLAGSAPTTAGDYHVFNSSPAIDAGNNALVTAAVDLAGNPRIGDGNGDSAAVVDLGSYETPAAIWFVDATPLASLRPAVVPDGLSWTTAYTNLQDALSWVISSTQIWVAEGIYYPDDGAGQVDNDHRSTFQLSSGVQVYGGFEGGETSLDQRTNWAAHPTILSGDLEQNDVTENGVITDTDQVTGTNARTVVTGDGLSSATRLDGFTITGGNSQYASGGGMYIDISSPTLENLVFSGNAAGAGGGMYSDANCSPTLTNVVFTGNSADEGGGMYNLESSPILVDVDFMYNHANDYAGGLYNYNLSSPTITNARFIGNYAGEYGGGMLNESDSLPVLVNVLFSENKTDYYGGGMANYDNGSPTITNARFIGNYAGEYGGGMLNEINSLPVLVNVLFSGNKTDFYGGGMANYDNGSPSLTNVAFIGNYSGDLGGGMYNEYTNKPTLTNVTFSGNHAVNYGGGIYNYDSDDIPVIRNTILWGNTAGDGPEIYHESGSAVFSSSLVAGCNPGGTWDNTCGTDNGGNLDDADPIFINPIAASSAPTTTGNYRLQPGSPAIDTGSNTYNAQATDLDGNARKLDGDFDSVATIDVGAYEYQVACSSSGMLYVDMDAAGAETGYSWSDAYTSLQDALAIPGDCEIWVAAGIYYPDDGAEQLNNAPNSTFNLKEEAAIYGGFAATETLRSQRDWVANPTILSGDIDHETNPDTNTDGNGINEVYSDTVGLNAYQVVKGVGISTAATLDGFIITGGKSTGLGGGVALLLASPTLANLVISGNAASNGGGLGLDQSSPALTNVVISGNKANFSGGGMHHTQSSPTLTDVRITNNLAVVFNGGGINNINNSHPLLTNVTINGNTAATGGGISNDESSPSLVNVAIFGNQADYGGGIYNDNDSNPVLVNVTLANNNANYGGGMSSRFSSPDVTNSLIWGNTAIAAYQLNNILSTPIFRFSLVDECSPAGVWNGNCGTDGGDNLPDADPLFASPVPGAAAPTTLGDYRLQDTSPAIDAGNTLSNTTLSDLDSNPRLFRTAIDLGAYENQSLLCPAGGVLHVDANVTGGEATGLDWTNAFPNLQDALQVVDSCEIWVAQGSYYPDEGAAQSNDVISSTFALKDGLAVYGGFAGTETQRTERDWGTNLTILSGDLDQNDTADRGVVTHTDNLTGTNAYHVVTTSGTGSSTVLDGFTITAGQADGTATAPCGSGCGGGLFNDAGSPTLANLTFTGNWAERGGGMLNYTGSPVMTDITFSANYAQQYGGALYTEDPPAHLTLTGAVFSDNVSNCDGGAIFNYDGSKLTLANASFTNNQANCNGGAVYNYNGGWLTVSNSSFTGNQAAFGGAISNWISYLNAVNTTFTGNQASSLGGALYNAYYSTILIENATITGNQAQLGGAVHNYSVHPILTNVTLSGNTATQAGGGMYSQTGSQPDLTNVLISGNQAPSGGGVYNQDSSPTLTNVTIAGNQAVTAGGGMYSSANSHPIIQNSIIWGNAAPNGDTLVNLTTTLTISHSLVEGCRPDGVWNTDCGFDGGGNLADADPAFVNPAAASSAPTTAGDYRLLAASPAIDMGDIALIATATDLDGNGRITHNLVDLGAYESDFLRVVLDAAETSTPEGSGSITLYAHLSRPVTYTVTSAYSTLDGTAQAGSDYTAAAGVLTFAPNQTQTQVTINILEDTLNEAAEVFFLVLTDTATTFAGYPYRGQVTITDNDAAPTVQFSSAVYSATEGTTATITVTLSAASALPITITYTTGDDTAVAGIDYTQTTGNLFFAPGSTSQAFAVVVLEDQDQENTESLILTLSQPINSALGTPNPARLDILVTRYFIFLPLVMR